MAGEGYRKGMERRDRVDSSHPGSAPETVELRMAVFTLERVQFVSSVLCMEGSLL